MKLGTLICGSGLSFWYQNERVDSHFGTKGILIFRCEFLFLAGRKNYRTKLYKKIELLVSWVSLSGSGLEGLIYLGFIYHGSLWWLKLTTRSIIYLEF